MIKKTEEEWSLLRQVCIIYSRVCGWCAPTSAFNPGKVSEFNDRKTYTNGQELND